MSLPSGTVTAYTVRRFVAAAEREVSLVLTGRVNVALHWLKHLHEIASPYRSGLGKR